MSYRLQEITPAHRPDFCAEACVGTFQIVSLNVRYDFDATLENMEVRQEFQVQRVGDGPAQWCARVMMNTHLECEYEDSDGKPLDSELILDANKHHYMVCSFPDRILAKTGTFRFAVRMVKRSQLSEQHSARKNEKAFFITQIYGDDCTNFRMLITWPPEYTLVNSIPRLSANSEGYVYTPTIQKFDPVEVALVLKRGFVGRLKRLFARDSHPFVWVLVAAAVSLGIAGVWSLMKLILKTGE